MLVANTENVTGYHRQAEGVLQPSTVDDVRRLVHDAIERKAHLYPFSTGLNWGYGSRSPVLDNAVLVDLSKMNRIRNADQISVDHPVALIEPGVTQRQLHEFLKAHCPELTFNVTGAGADTSILGNSLDRGVGYFGPRKEDLFGLEIVTGSGELIHTGFRRLGDESPLAQCHPFGLGPMIDGLFFQGNFGIVTSACFRLIPKRPKEVAVSMALRDAAHLPEFIDLLSRLKREGLLTSVTHIGNRARTHSTLTFGVTQYLEKQCGMSPERAISEAGRAISMVARDEWTGLAAVTGNSAQVRAALSEIKARMRRIAKVIVITDGLLDFGYAVTHAFRFVPFARANAAAIAAIRPLHKLALGEPTDVAVENLLWKYGQSELAAGQLDQSRVGLLFVNPALPLDGKFVSRVVEEMTAIAKKQGHELYMTLNIETATSLVAVINLLFDRTVPEELEQAHQCADELFKYIRNQGLEVYRARTDMMDKVIDIDSPYWKTIRKLKEAFDPDNLIAPGRYNLP